MHTTDWSDAIRLTIAALLILATAAKAVDQPLLRGVLSELGVKRSLLVPAGWAVVVIELLTAGAVLLGPATLAGVMTAGLFTGFAAVVIRLRNSAVQCRCLGKLAAASHHLRRRVALRLTAAAAGVGIAIAGSPTALPHASALALAGAMSTCLLAPFALRAASSSWAMTAPSARSGAATAGAVTDRRAFLRRAALVTAGVLLALAVLPKRAFGNVGSCDTMERDCLQCCEDCLELCIAQGGNPADCAQANVYCQGQCQNNCYSICQEFGPGTSCGFGCWDTPDMCKLEA